MGCTAFGGPQMHLPMFRKKLVEDKRFIDAETLTDINAFCSILPGPSTTQTITALGFKLGGPMLAFLSLLAWVLPGALLVGLIALSPNFLAKGHLRFLQPMVAAFMCYGVISMFGMIRKDNINYLIFLLAGIMGYFFRSPILFPLGVIIGGIISSRYGNRKFTPNTTPFGKVRWANLTLYLIIFLLIGIAGVLLSINEKTLGLSRPIVFFENTYRMGSLAFGGGNMLSAMAMEQYVSHRPRLSMLEFNTGLGIIQGLPGPNFNLAVYFNTVAMRNAGFDFSGQLLGGIIGMIAIFLPGTLLVFFVYPIWSRLQHYPIVQRSLDGIFAASVGFILSAALIINEFFWLHRPHSQNPNGELLVFTGVLLALIFKKISPPLIVCLCFLLGLIWTLNGL